MEMFSQDFRFGARVLGRTPLLTAAIIAILSLGIGANSAIFGILNRLLLHSLPYPDPERLVFVWSTDSHGALSTASPADFLDWRSRTKSFSSMSAWIPTQFVYASAQRPRQIAGARVTADFFRTLDVKPVLGRGFLPDEDGLEHAGNASHSALISYRLWEQEFSRDPNVLGRLIHVDSVSYAVVGVLPADFHFWFLPQEVWIPVTVNPRERDYRNFRVVGRMSAPRAQAMEEMKQIAGELAQAYPKSDRGWSIAFEDLLDRFLGSTFRLRLLLVAFAAGLVLLLACTNVAGLLLARMAARDKEFALRMSLGATGWRLGRQMLTESALLAAAGGVLGLGVAWVLIRAVPVLVPAGVLPVLPFELSGTVLWFCAGVSAATCLVVGVAPALLAARADTAEALKASGRGMTADRGARLFRQGLVAAEIAVTMVLLAAAWTMAGGLRALLHLDLGFDPKNVLTVRMVLPAAKYDPAQSVRFYRTALERIARVAGVERATFGTTLPLTTGMQVRFDRLDSAEDEAQQPSVSYTATGTDFFETLKIPLRRGRFFSETDSELSAAVAVVSESFARRYFPGEDPVGKALVIFRPIRPVGEEKVTIQVVGVAGDIEYSDLTMGPQQMIYVPYAQNPFARGVIFALRTRGNPAQCAQAVRNELMSLDPNQPVDEATTIDQTLDGIFAQPRFEAQLVGAFAAMALLLASIGMYGLNAHAVEQRRGEIGVRMALGATSGAVLREVLGGGLRLVAMGVVAGLAGALVLGKWLASVFETMGRVDVGALIGAAVVLTAVATLASFIPARRATRIDPAVTLRNE